MIGRVKYGFAKAVAAVVLGLALFSSLALLGGCSKGAGTDCSLDQCTVTFDRGADAKKSVLGVEVELVKVEGDKATVKVGGKELTLTVGQPAADAAGLKVTLESITDTNVVVKISR